ncbi:MAG: hypothetical protein KDB22_24070, partial [Planctomycetales bacterium]|nr:hypothetical protein [Planctomycetales bacterium]
SSNTDSILRYQGPTGSSPGEYIDTFVTPGSGGLDYIGSGSMKFDDDGNLYVASQYTNSVLQFSGSDGTFVRTVVASGDGGLLDPTGIEFDASGNLYVSSRSTSEILRYSPDSNGSFKVSLNRESESIVTVQYSVANGTAESNSDFAPSSGTITFAPGETSHTIIIPTVDDLDLEGDETFYVNLTNAVGGDIVDAQGVGTIVDNEVPPQVDVSATSESNVYGSVAGSYLATQAADGVVETLTEERYSSNRRTRLEHRWRFDNVTSGDSVELLVTAAQTNSNPVETFAFSYSTDNANWTTLGNLGPSSYQLPNNLSGTVYVRVVDTDRSNNEKTLDVLAVDQLLIRTTIAPANLSSPFAPPPSSFATTAVLHPSSTEEEQLRNNSLISEPVLAAPTAKPQRAQSSVAPLATTASLPARSTSSDGDANSVDEVFGDWGLDSSVLLGIANFGL